MNFLHSFQPKAIAFSVGPLNVYWYGLFIVVGIIAGFIVALYLANKKQVNKDHFYNLFFYFIIFGLIGGRLVHVLSEWSYYKDHLSETYRIWLGGLGLHGVIFACLIVLIIYTKIKKTSFWLMADVLAMGIPLAQFIGRWGNYFNQEIYGKSTSFPWGIPIDLEKRPFGLLDKEYYHPLFLYESLLDLMIFVILLILSRAKFIKQGEIFLIYLITYSMARFSLDFLRINPVSAGPLSLAQWVSLLLILSSAIIIIFRRKKALN